jgi:hypothetical protein
MRSRHSRTSPRALHRRLCRCYPSQLYHIPDTQCAGYGFFVAVIDPSKCDHGFHAHVHGYYIDDIVDAILQNSVISQVRSAHNTGYMVRAANPPKCDHSNHAHVNGYRSTTISALHFQTLSNPRYTVLGIWAMLHLLSVHPNEIMAFMPMSTCTRLTTIDNTFPNTIISQICCGSVVPYTPQA